MGHSVYGLSCTKGNQEQNKIKNDGYQMAIQKNPARKNKEKETKLKSVVYKRLIVQVY